MGLTYKRHFSLRKVLHRTLLTARSIAPPGLPPLCSAQGGQQGLGNCLLTLAWDFRLWSFTESKMQNRMKE